jgi:succinate dehydrogenase/fumarate reductase cytochrome b subunit
MHFVADKKNSVIEVISKIQIALTNKHFQRDFFNNVKTFKFIIVLNFDVMYSVIVWLFHILVQIRTCMSEFSRTFSS